MNYSSIKNKQNLTPNEIINLINQDLKEKWNLSVKGEYDAESGSYELEINSLLFTFFNTQDNNIDFYDGPSAALERHNQNHPYFKDSYLNSLYKPDSSTAFFFLYEYIKHLLAYKLKSKICSESGEVYQSLKAEKRFNSFNDWMDHCEIWRKNQDEKFYKKSNVSKEEVIFKELNHFPQLKKVV